VLVILVLLQIFDIEIAPKEILSLGGALGFGIGPIFLGLNHILGIGHFSVPLTGIIGAAIGTLMVPALKRKPWKEYEELFLAFNDLFIFAIGVLLLFAAYNLQQFHYGADGAIVTHGLFGVDIPFLAGEVHGIRDFGALRDQHQMGQPWRYHDWTYQLLALLPRERTLADLAFAAPLVGCTLLAFSIYTITFRLTISKYIAYISVALWFLISGLQGGELSSYALSPSFVFGSMIFLNVLLAFSLRVSADRQAAQWVFSGMIFYLLVMLSQTKLSSFLVMMGGMGLVGLIGLIGHQKQRKIGMHLLLASLLSLAVVLWQNMGSNPLMPSGDFLIGAPLLGYANHLATMLHVPVSAINPVSHGLTLHWRSLLIIPFFVFHFLRFALTDPKILSAIVVIVFLRKFLWQKSKEIVLLLVILIPLGFLFPVLYSPAWYPLALSFYAPLVSVQAALLIGVVGIAVFLKNKTVRPAKICMGLIGLMCLIGIALQVHSITKEESARPSIVSASFVHAMNYLQANAGDSAIVATRRFDLDSTGDESYYWYGALSGRTIISEGAKYGSMLAAVADTNAEKGLHPSIAADELLLARRALLDTIYRSKEMDRVKVAVRLSQASYIVETGFPGERLSVDPALFARRMFVEGEYEIWKIR
jgi:hypothetical protein